MHKGQGCFITTLLFMPKERRAGMGGIYYMHVSVLENPELFEKGLSLVSVERREKVTKLKNHIPARLSLAAGILLRFAMEKNGQGIGRMS